MQNWRIGLLCALLSPLAAVARPAQAPSTATGVITGVVTDGSGTPVVGARVQAVVRRQRWAGPYYETPVGRPDESDDRGRFRLHSLAPGHYVVAVAVGPTPSDPSATSGYLRTYNPGTPALASAAVVSVDSGEEQSVSVRVGPVPLMQVRGVALTSAGEPAATYSVSLRGGPAAMGYAGPQGGYTTPIVATGRVAGDGAFLLSRVPAGAYMLTVTNGPNRPGSPLEIAEVPVNVTDAAPADLKVVTARGATVSGRLTWADRGPAPWPLKAAFGRLRAIAVGRDSDFARMDVEIQADGTFRFTELYGLRRIEAFSLPFNWTVVSVRAPKEVLDGPNLKITPGTDVTDVEVVVTNRPGTVIATVADEAGQPFLTGSVLLMPRNAAEVDALGWGFRATQKNRGASGVWYYAMERVVPGAYLAVAIDVEPYRLTGDADLMERARAAALPVQVTEGDMPLSLRVVRLRPFAASQ